MPRALLCSVLEKLRLPPQISGFVPTVELRVVAVAMTCSFPRYLYRKAEMRLLGRLLLSRTDPEGPEGWHPGNRMPAASGLLVFKSSRLS